MVLTSQSFKERQLLTEFAQFRTTPLPGIYLSLHPTTPTTWYGVIFLRSHNTDTSSTTSTSNSGLPKKKRKEEEIYSNIPIRFSISFGNRYPDVPPFVLIHGGLPPSTKGSNTGSGEGGSDGGGNDRGGSGSGTGEIIPHPLISRSASGSGRGLSAGYAGVHTGAVNLRDCYSGWFEPKGLPPITRTSSATAGSIVAAKVTNGGRIPGSAAFPPGTSPVEVIFYLRSIFTEKYLRGLEERLDDGEIGEDGVIVDEEAWGLWRGDRAELRRRVEGLRRRGWDEGVVFGEWDGGGDVPIRFLDLQREALDTIKENLGRRLVGGA
ncbi:hypothetical protein TWF694_004528 [Orbilia ellipsospora]|uniref:Uncharacterized protein n=1 Tax=Orbilia ellipsospora TaxID=2528407 RepID=A0AAV9WXM1_9PEZI